MNTQTNAKISPKDLLATLKGEASAIAKRSQSFREALLTGFTGSAEQDSKALESFKLVEFVKAYMASLWGEVWPSGWQKEEQFKDYKNVYNAFNYALQNYKKELNLALGMPTLSKADAPSAPMEQAVKKFEAAIKAVEGLPAKNFNAYAKSMVSKIIEQADLDLLEEIGAAIEAALEGMNTKKVSAK